VRAVAASSSRSGESPMPDLVDKYGVALEVVGRDPVRVARTPMPETREEWDRYVSDLFFDGAEIRLPDETAERVARLLSRY
jgi:hypothetical protein